MISYKKIPILRVSFVFHLKNLTLNSFSSQNKILSDTFFEYKQLEKCIYGLNKDILIIIYIYFSIIKI